MTVLQLTIVLALVLAVASGFGALPLWLAVVVLCAGLLYYTARK